jgi:hypothetical protein
MKTQAPTRHVRPCLEALEDRLVMTAAVPTPHVATLFLGSAWQQIENAPFFLALNTAGILNSPFMDALTGPYGVNRGDVVFGAIQAADIPSGATVTNAEIKLLVALDALFGEFGSGNGMNLPVVFLPPNVTFTAVGPDGTNYSSRLGAPNSQPMSGLNDWIPWGNTQLHYVVIAFPGGTNVSANGQTNLDAFTEILSHEIAEATVGLQIADQLQAFHYRMSNGQAIEEVGQPNDFATPIPVPGATPLVDISGWGIPS